MKNASKFSALAFASTLLGTASFAAVTALALGEQAASVEASASYITIKPVIKSNSAPPVVIASNSVDVKNVPLTSLPVVSTDNNQFQPAPSTPIPTVLPGVNISGAEFGKVPGRAGYDYNYPKNSDIDYYANKGFKIIRIPFRWQRMQPDINGPLSPTERAALNKVVLYANSRGLIVALDMHDYSKRLVNDRAAVVGTPDLPTSALADAWTRIAEDYRGNDQVWLGIMNEPSGISVSNWWQVVQDVVVRLRSKGINNKLLVPGASWTGAHSWIKSGNSALAEKFRDPKNNFAFEVHQYFDKDSSGTTSACVAGSAKRLDAVLDWARRRDVKLFVGEMAGSADPICSVEYAEALKKLNTSSAVIGWTAWGGGAWWNRTYMFRLNPLTVGGSETAHMLMLMNNLTVKAR